MKMLGRSWHPGLLVKCRSREQKEKQIRISVEAGCG